MKRVLLFSLIFFFAGALITTTTGCDKDETATCADGIQNGDETGVDCGGTCTACPTCDDGIQNGDETGVDCGGDCDPCLEGIQGEWQSSGDNVAPILVQFFQADSIWAQFNTDLTYVVHQFDQAGAQTTLEGTYIQANSGVDDIWTITVNQTSPAAFTSAGIFQVTAGTPDQMKYEIVLDNGQNIPPTPEGGFGSSNAGALGESNIQVYERL